MSEGQDLEQYFLTLFNAVSGSKVGSLVSFVGLLCFLMALAATFKALKTDAQDVQPWLKWLLFVSLFAAIVFSAGGPSVALLGNTHAEALSRAQIIDNGRMNKRVSWLVRFVVFDPQQHPEFGAGSLASLGRGSEKFVFVADYSELLGHTAAQAVRMVGGSVAGHEHVTAIIFPKSREDLYPANAKGVLQVIRYVQRNNAIEPERTFDTDKSLRRQDFTDLADTKPLSIYSWDKYAASFPTYCRIVQMFRCSQANYAARSLIGELGGDWHPLGFSRLHAHDKCEPTSWGACETAVWDQAAQQLSQDVGARVFLIANKLVNEIPGRIMVDFDDAEKQFIPDLRLPTKQDDGEQQ